MDEYGPPSTYEPNAPLLSRGKLLILILFVLIIVASGGAALWLGRSGAVRDKAQSAGSVTSGSANVAPTPPEAPPIRIVSDADHDGLRDEEEAQLGTNPTSADTDGDGLFDYEEVRVWLTDPRNVDSDGDGFPDGGEVRAGFNPGGPGEIRNTNEAIAEQLRKQ